MKNSNTKKHHKMDIGEALKNAGLVSGGAIGVQFAESLATKTLLKNTTVKPAVMGIGKIVLGALIPWMAGKANSDLAQPIANCVTAAGALQVARASFPGMVPGIGGLDDVLNGLGDEESYYVEGVGDDADETLNGVSVE